MGPAFVHARRGDGVGGLSYAGAVTESISLPSFPRVGVMLPRDLPPHQVIPFARRAEQLGFDELWVVEDLGWRGGIAQAGVVLAATEQIEVGIGILPAGARNAAFSAMELATLTQLFPGRVVAGIGHGMPDFMRRAGAWPASPLTLLREYTVAVRALLRGERGPAAGRYVDVAGVVLTELPDTPPPVVLGVRGPKSLALAGDVSDGIVLAEPAAPEYVFGALAATGRIGEHRGDFRVFTYDVAAVDDDRKAALAAVRPGLEAIGEPDWAPHISPLPFADQFAERRAACATGAEFAATMPDDWVSALTLSGTPNDVRERIVARGAAGADSVVLTPVGDDRMVALEAFAAVLQSAR